MTAELAAEATQTTTTITCRKANCRRSPLPPLRPNNTIDRPLQILKESLVP